MQKLEAKLKASVVAVLLALPVASMAADSNADLRKEIELLKAKIKELEQKIDAVPAPAQAAPAESVDPVEFNRIRVKTEGLEDTLEMNGFKGLKVTGYIDPTWVYSERANGGSFTFLNENYSSDPSAAVNDFTQDTFSYYNSYFGGVTLKVEKEFEGGLKSMFSLRPRRSVANTLSFGQLFEEAEIWVPLGSLTWKATAGQTITWNGYEYVQAPLKKNITSNLLLDFGGPGYMTGAGLEYLQGKWWVKTSVGNISNSHTPHGYDGQGAHWRVDYAKGEFQGWGASGLHGKVYQHGYNYLEADAYFIRGDVTLQGQIEGSQWQHAGFSGATTGTFGLSGLAAYKFTPQLEGIFRADYLDNHRGGGGTPATNTGNVNQLCPSGSATGELDKNGNPVTDINGDPAALCGDYRNGFGPGAVYDASAGVWALGDPNRGSKRSAFTVGLNYQYHLNGLLKTELRYDRSNLNSFYDWSSGGYKKDNLTFSVQTVVSWQ